MLSNQYKKDFPLFDDFYTQNQVPASKVNIRPVERILSTLGGGALLFLGIKRRDWPGTLLAILSTGLLFRGITGYSTLYQRLNVDKNRQQQLLTSFNVTPLPDVQGLRIRRSLTVNASPNKLYAFWKDLRNAPHFMPGVVSVKPINDTMAHWVAEGPTGKTYQWDSEIYSDQPDRKIAWHTVGKVKSLTAFAGSVTFEPATGERGTVVTLEMDYAQLKGKAGALIARLPEFEALETLRRFKELNEAGEIASVEGQPAGANRK